MQRSRDHRDRRRQRTVIIVGIAILLVIAGIVVYGFYDEFIGPPRVLAARVGDTRYTQGDLVKRMRMLQAASEALGQRLDLGRAPFQVLNSMAEAELIRRAAPSFDVQVPEADVELALLQRFYPVIPEGQEVQPDQIEREYRENYRSFLSKSHLSDEDYRKIVEESIYRVKLREKLGELVPSIGEQVEVHWIRLPSAFESQSTGPQGPSTEEVLDLLKKRDFGDVAGQFSTERRYADEKGYVGWVPKGVFSSLDETLFGSAEHQPIAHDEISQPIFTTEGTYILKVTAGPEEREISATMREGLKDQALDKWLLEQKDVGGREGWLEMNFSSDLYSWVNDQVRQTAPRATPPSSGGR